MKRYLLLILLLGLCACDSASFSSSTGTNTSASSTSSQSGTEVTLSGENGQAVLAGDQITIKAGKLFINAQHITDLAPNDKVKYSVVGDAKNLYINNVLTPVNH